MSLTNKVAMALDILESAEANVRSAKRMLSEIVGKDISVTDTPLEVKKPAVQGEDGKIVEGAFDGQSMNGYDGNVYPVPANYASKSKLIAGDVLKLTIAANGSFIYKQIGPAPRKRIVGILSYENKEYKVIASGRSYNVLLASVTYFRAEPGDRVTIIVPEKDDSEWAAIENAIPPGEDAEVEAEIQKALEQTKNEAPEEESEEDLDF